MTWARIYPFITNWPGGGTPPVFDIAADMDGTAVIEIAWDPQALSAPATYPQPLRYYSTNVDFSASVPRASGSGTLPVSVPAQTITVTGNRGTWMMPAALWAGYVEESLKTLSSPPASTFSRNLYYRVRVTPTGSATAAVWPSDAALAGPNAMSSPHIGILPVSATATSLVGLDTPAVAGLGGFGPVPTMWSQLLTAIWGALPETDPNRRSLAAVMAHPTYTGLPVGRRTEVLRLWLFAGRSRQKITALLARQAVVGSGVAMPIVSKIAAKGGKNLVAQLLDLVTITPHPDLALLAREQLIDDVITEILDPNGQVNQGGAGTCVPTSIQTMLITVNPAEYARLQVGWLSSLASAELANGHVADVPPAIFQVSRYNATGAATGNVSNVSFLFRTFSEMAFQGAMLKFGQGASFPVPDGTEPTLQKIFRWVYAGGLGSGETKRCLDALFNVNFTLSAVAWPTTMPGFSVVQAGIATSLEQAVDKRGQPLLLAVYWRTAPSTPVPAGVTPASFFASHAVLVLRHEGGRIAFKNPQYAGSSPLSGAANGGNAANPPRRYDDVGQSLESMSEADLAQWIYWYLAPDTAII
jgi:hypothetical protein